MQIVIKDIECPVCGNGETHPQDKNKLLIRAFKVHDGKAWRSQCLVCSGYYDTDLNETPSTHNPNKGWF